MLVRLASEARSYRYISQVERSAIGSSECSPSPSYNQFHCIEFESPVIMNLLEEKSWLTNYPPCRMPTTHWTPRSISRR